MSNKNKVFEGCWEPPSHLAPEKPSSSGIRDLFYYSPYWGWSSDVVPVLFKTPAEALCWGISRFKRDGLSNTWGSDLYPDFMYFVFVVSFRSGLVTYIVAATHNESCPSKIEQEYFKDVKFYKIHHDFQLLLSGYIKASPVFFQHCQITMKSTPD